MKNEALSNLKIIDLTHMIAGPYCTKLMAGFGADIIKIEPPIVGEKLRSMGPFINDNEGPETSIPFLWLNTGKKSITLNLKTEKGTEIFKQLVRGADAVIENFSPRVMPKLGLDYETLRDINPDLIMTSISNFGQTGSYRDFIADEIELYALCGAMYLTGDPHNAPLNSGPAVCQYVAGQHAYVATLMALFQRNITGESQYIDVSIQECAIENIEIALANYLQTAQIAKRGPHIGVPWALYECQDGYAQITAMPARHWSRAAEIFEDASLFEKKFEHILGRIGRREEFENLLAPRVKALKKKELFFAGQTRKLAFGYLADLDDVLESPQHKERHFFEEVDHPVAGTHPYCGAPFKMSRTPWQSTKAPLLGEHNDEIHGGVLRYSSEEIQAMKQAGVI